jgi:hypothetical protein
VAYEYVKGKPSNLSNISTDFFKDLVEYLQSRQLEATAKGLSKEGTREFQ